MTTLSPVRGIFRAVVCTVAPQAAQLDEEGWRELETLVDVALRGRPSAMLRQLRWFLLAIQWLSVFRYGRPFTSLRPEKRARVLSRLQDHPLELIRCGFWGIRTLALLGFYGRAETVRAIGYAADPRGWSLPR